MRIGFDAKRFYQNTSGLGNYSRQLIADLHQFQPITHDCLQFMDIAGDCELLALTSLFPNAKGCGCKVDDITKAEYLQIHFTVNRYIELWRNPADGKADGVGKVVQQAQTLLAAAPQAERATLVEMLRDVVLGLRISVAMRDAEIKRINISKSLKLYGDRHYDFRDAIECCCDELEALPEYISHSSLLPRESVMFSKLEVLIAGLGDEVPIESRHYQYSNGSPLRCYNGHGDVKAMGPTDIDRQRRSCRQILVAF
jgi:hypothetical protein